MRRQTPAIGPLESLGGRTDGQLLDRFRSGDPGEAAPAFEALVARHGPMVLRACRWALGDRHAAEDAFQVTFLALARRAGSIRDRDSVASWLLGVARRVAARARRAEGRRHARERRRGVAIDAPPRRPEAVDDLGSRALDELARLPGPQRAAVALCYLEGHTCEDAARILGWPVGTVKSRLARARDRLRDRLGPPSLMLAPPVPPRLADSTVRLAAMGSSSPAHAGLLSTVPGATMSPILAPWKWPALALATSLGLALALALARPDEPPARTVQEPPPKPEAPAAAVAPPRVPRELQARAGSGSAQLFKLDPKGERVAVPGARQPRQGPFEEEVRDLRWVALVATIDHRAAIAAEALDRNLGPADPAARPEYVRVDVERQSRPPAGDWSEWAPVDLERDYQLLDNMTEEDKEQVPQQLRPSALVDPLPFLRAGTWKGVNPMKWDDSVDNPLNQPGRSRDLWTVVRKVDPLTRARSETDQPELMIRHLDFTVEPGATYRYRIRVVVRNPDQEPKMIPRQLGPQIPGRDDRRGRLPVRPQPPPRERFWPWSDPSPEVKAL